MKSETRREMCVYLEGESTACYLFIPSMLLKSLDKGISS